MNFLRMLWLRIAMRYWNWRLDRALIENGRLKRKLRDKGMLP